MRVCSFEHMPFEGLGNILPWLQSRDISVEHCRFYQNDVMPALEDVDWLIVMGGPMSVNDTDEFPWLSVEKQFIRRMISANKPVLGICLGAQLIASAMGSRVYPNKHKEIGWWPLLSQDAPQLFPNQFQAFHWHGETFELPSDAKLLASSKACQNQAFQIGDRVIGIQFHLETTPESAQALITHLPEDLQPGEYVQSASQILLATAEDYQSMNRLMVDLLSFLHSKTVY